MNPFPPAPVPPKNGPRDGVEALVVDVINAATWKVPLAGLSTEAIECWISANRIDPHAILVDLVYRTSEVFGHSLEEQLSTEERAAFGDELRSLLVSIDAEIAPRRGAGGNGDRW